MTPIFSSTPARVFDIGNFPRHFFHTTSVSKPANEEDAQKDVEPAMDIPDTKTVPNGVEGSPSKIASEKNPEQQESLLAGVDVSKKKLCGVCNQNEGKYKCSRCYLPSCSLACSAIHKATHPAIEPKPVEVKVGHHPQSNGTAPRLGTVAAVGFQGPFAALDDSKELQTLFEMYPQLPSRLEEINTATLRPPESLDNHMQNGSSRGKKEEPWTLDRGLEKGRQALNRARDTDEGVREYSKLILQILSGEAGISAAELVQRELAAESAKIIEALLKGEM